MIGRMSRGDITLDYTHICSPVSADDVGKDICEVYSSALCCNEVVLWEHQWDWMTKDVDQRGVCTLCGAREPDSRFGHKTVWGVRVRFKEDPGA